MSIRQFFIPLRRYCFNKYLSGLLFALLTVIALARAFQQYYFIDAAKAVQYSLLWHIPFNLFIWWLWLLFVPVIYWITINLNVRSLRQTQGVVMYLLLPVSIICIRHAIASVIVCMFFEQYTFLYVFTGRTLRGVGIWIDFVVYFSIMIGVRIIEYQQKAAMDKLIFTHLQARITQSQLSALKSQLRPHFLFNTLNSLSTSIVLNENNEAKRMLSLITNFLKTTLDERVHQEISFEQELNFINQYLEIEKVRFEEKLAIQEEIAPDTLLAAMPSFLLLPLVENCIYHAIAPKVSGGILRIASEVRSGELVIIVEDDGPGLEGFTIGKNTHEGVGIKNTKERLFFSYGENHTLRFENGNLGGLKVTVKIPFKHIDKKVFEAH
jgi:two-component system, LytTR family, sensor kinase